MNQHGQVKTADEDASKRDWKNDVKIAGDCSEYRWTFIKILEKFETTCNGRLGRTSVAKHRKELEPPNQSPIHSTPYRAWSKAGEFEKQEVRQMLAEKDIESAQTECAAAIAFVQKKDKSLHFGVENWKFNAGTIRVSYSLPLMEKCIDSSEGESVFSTLDVNCGYWNKDVE